MTDIGKDLLLEFVVYAFVAASVLAFVLLMRHPKPAPDATFLWVWRRVRRQCNDDAVCVGGWAWLVWARPCACGGLAVIE